MLRWAFVFLAAAAVRADEIPFWKAKEKVYSRVQNGDIIVSVKSAPAADGFKNRLSLAGGGQVRAPRDFVFRYAQDFDQIARLSGFIEKARYDRDRHLLDATISAFGRTADLQFKVESGAEAEPRRMDFEMVKGPLKGLRSRLLFTVLSGVKSEVGIEGDYRYDQFPIPKFFLEFGMEVVFQKMATRLRQQAETAFRAESAKK